MSAIRSITATLVLSATLATMANAQTNSTERVDQRQANQSNRIQQGINNGQLNEREANRLQKGQAHVQKMENRAVADGKVTAGERARIEAAQDVQSARIARQRHDAQKAH
jgi:high-affinity K+ transport system ATPase subunit B